MLEQITPLIITYNEAPNIERTLGKLRWASRVVVIDSGSNDGTIDIVKRFANAQVLQRAFESFASQCNFGLTQVQTPWTLSLDADYELSDALIGELHALNPSVETAGYRAAFIYRIYGRDLRGTLYPPRVVLYRSAHAHYQNQGHGHRVEIAGEIKLLKNTICHNDQKPLSRWLESQQKYARKEADHLLKADRAILSVPDRLRLMAWPAPFLVGLYTLILKGCVFDGWRGWFYVLQRVLAEIMLAIAILDLRLGHAFPELPRKK